MELQKKLANIQKELKASKSSFNKFGNYYYRNAEDILEAVKPLLNGAILTISDEIVLVGSRFYVKACAKISDGSEAFEACAFAREPEIQKGMAEPQVTGSASSYARKYALNGLFVLDDTKDADSQDNTKKEVKESVSVVDRPLKESFVSSNPSALVTEKQVKLINWMIVDTKSDREKIKQLYKVESMNNLTQHEAQDLISKLKIKQENKTAIAKTMDELTMDAENI